MITANCQHSLPDDMDNCIFRVIAKNKTLQSIDLQGLIFLCGVLAQPNKVESFLTYNLTNCYKRDLL